MNQNNRFQQEVYSFVGIWFFIVLMLATACNTNNTNNNKLKNASEDTTLSAIERIPQIQNLSKLIAQDTSNAQLYFMRGNMYLQANVPQKAINDYSKAIVLDSTNATYSLVAANFYFTSKLVPTAISILEKANSIIPNNADILSELGKYYFYMPDQYGTSKKYLNSAIKNNENQAEAYFWLGMNLRDQDSLSMAIDYMETALTKDSTIYNANMILADMYSNLKDKTALKYYDKALNLDSLSVEAYYGKAVFWQNLGKKDKAIQAYKDLIRVDPQYQDAYYNMGYIYFNENNFEKAKAHFNIAIRMDVDFAKAYYMRGLCAEKLGDSRAAIDDYENALNFDPNYTKAQERLSALIN